MCYLCGVETKPTEPTESEYWDPEQEQISASVLANAIRKVAEENPDKVYVRPVAGSICYYTHTDNETGVKTPGCIVGQAIFRLIGKLVRQGDLSGPVGNHHWTRVLETDPSDRMDSYLRDWMAEVQRNQDAGASWLNAVRDADRLTSFR